MRTRVFWYGSWILAWVASCYGGATDRLSPHDAESFRHPYTVDDMMKVEAINAVRFDEAGNHLIVERVGPYGETPEFVMSFPVASGNSQTTLLHMNPARDAALAPLPGSEGRKLFFESFSPDGTRAVVFWFESAVARVGVYDFKAQQLTRMNYVPLYGGWGDCPFGCVTWVTNTEFLHFEVSEEEQKRDIDILQYARVLGFNLVQNTREGKVPAVAISGSGSDHGFNPRSDQTLVRVDAKSGATTRLASGHFTHQTMSPLAAEGRYYYLVSKAGVGNAARKMFEGRESEPELHHLEVIDLRTGQSRSICGGCDVEMQSPRWSRSGSKLFFFKRVLDKEHRKPVPMVYDATTTRLAEVQIETWGLKYPAGGRSAQGLPRFAWLRDKLLFSAQRKDSAEGTKSDLYVMDVESGEPANITARFRNSADDFVATARDEVLYMSEGDLWSVTSTGIAKRLTGKIHNEELQLQPWCYLSSGALAQNFPSNCSGFRIPNGHGVPLSDPEEMALQKGWISLVGTTGERLQRILFFNIHTGQSLPVQSPGPDYQLLTASALARAAVFRRLSDDGDEIVMVRTDGTRKTLLSYNSFLKDVESFRPILLKRPTPSGERNDWLLLPPGAKPGDHLPMVVTFYPDQTYSERLSLDDMRTVDFMNRNLLTSHGYAVLLVSMYLPAAARSVEPLVQIPPQLIAAAENAYRSGYVDGERWGLMGFSYGGYGTLCTIAHTNRFKAAVAFGGVYNLTSAYGMVGMAKRLDGEDAFPEWADWSEGGQGRMVDPPWVDPQRYIRNSPFFYADRISTPVLFAVGSDDVLVGQTDEMFNALLRQGKDARRLFYWGETHSFVSQATLRDLWENIYQWLDRYLGPGAHAPAGSSRAASDPSVHH